MATLRNADCHRHQLGVRGPDFWPGPLLMGSSNMRAQSTGRSRNERYYVRGTRQEELVACRAVAGSWEGGKYWFGFVCACPSRPVLDYCFLTELQDAGNVQRAVVDAGSYSHGRSDRMENPEDTPSSRKERRCRRGNHSGA